MRIVGYLVVFHSFSSSPSLAHFTSEKREICHQKNYKLWLGRFPFSLSFSFSHSFLFLDHDKKKESIGKQERGHFHYFSAFSSFSLSLSFCVVLSHQCPPPSAHGVVCCRQLISVHSW